MDYKYFNTGHVEEGSIVKFYISRTANVVLLDPYNYNQYKKRQSFTYYGGRYSAGDHEIVIPYSGDWFLVADLGGAEGSLSVSACVEGKYNYAREEPRSWQIQDDNDDFMVKVSSRYIEKNPRYGTGDLQRTDFLIFDKATGKHKHYSVDTEGNMTDWHKWKR